MHDRATPASCRRPNAIPRICLPLPPAAVLTMKQVGAVMKRGRKLRNKGRITAHDFGVLDTLMFQCRSPRTGTIEVSYSALQKITGFARGTISGAITRLTGCNLVLKIKRRLRVAWHQGGTTSRQATNCYQFIAPTDDGHTEFSTQPVDRELELTFTSPAFTADSATARASLDALSKQRRARLEETRKAERAVKVKAGWICAY